MKFYDSGKMSSRKFTKEGFLVAKAKVGRPGTQVYVKDIDFTPDDLPEYLRSKPSGSKIILFRPRDEVFKADSMASFEGKPVTNDHPTGAFVDSTNVKKFQVGFSKSIQKTPDSLTADLVIQDESTIKQVKDGKDQISLGYECLVDWTPGTDDEFGKYDGIQRNITGNHIAIVSQARAGSDFRLKDKKETPKTEKERIMSKIRMIDGISIELSDQGAEAFDKMKVALDHVKVEKEGVEKKLADTQVDLEKAKGELEAQKASQVTDEDIQAKVDQGVKAHLEVLDQAVKACPEADFSGKTTHDIKVEAIHILGDGKVETDGQSVEFVDACFLALTKVQDKKTKQLADGLDPQKGDPVVKLEDSREKMKKARGPQAV